MNRPAATDGWLVLLALAAPASCGLSPTPPASFALAREWAPVLEGRRAARGEALAVLEELFGTPDRPRYGELPAWAARGFDPNRPHVAEGHGGSGELSAELWEEVRAGNRERFADELAAIDAGDLEAVGPWALAPDLSAEWNALRAELAGDAEAGARARTFLVDHYPSLRDSGRLYAKRCLTCHGTEGGGDGPGARFLKPTPRDFRQGVFKFTALAEHARPRRQDLVRILADGIQHTAMPSFAGHSPAELHGLADYVRFLAVRGESELWWLEELTADDAIEAADAREAYRGVFEEWWRADVEEVPLGEGMPPVTAELLAQGRRLYHDEALGNCASCHGRDGLGPEQAPRTEGGASFRDAWGRPIEARNLRQGPFRFGDAPEDVYRRLYAGIHGTPMPGVGNMLGADGEPIVSSAELWALTAYVVALRTGDAP